MELNQVCELIVDCEHKTAPTQETGYPSIRTPNIGRGRFILDGVNRVSEETYQLWTRRAVPQPGDLIMAREAPVGNVAIIPEGLRPCLGQRTLLIRPDRTKVEPAFLNYFLNGPHVQGLIHAKTNGATVAHLNMKDVRTMTLPPLPPLPVQRRIAGILSAYDELMENSQRRIRLLEAMARALYREWFVHFRFPGHETHPRVASPLGDIPQGWEVKPLNDIVEDIVDYRGKTPTKLGGEWSNEGILALSALNVKGGRLVNLEKSKRVDEELYARWMKNPLRQGDILMTSEAPLGELFYLCKHERYCLSQRLFSIRANPKVIAPVLLYLNLESDQTQHELQSRASGATVSGIRQSELRKVPVVVPSSDAQKRAEPILQQLAEQIHTLDAQIQNLRRTRDLLLPRLLSGQVELKTQAA